MSKGKKIDQIFFTQKIKFRSIFLLVFMFLTFIHISNRLAWSELLPPKTVGKKCDKNKFRKKSTKFFFHPKNKSQVDFLLFVMFLTFIHISKGLAWSELLPEKRLVKSVIRINSKKKFDQIFLHRKNKSQVDFLLFLYF